MRKNWKKMLVLTLCLSMATGCQNAKETKVDKSFDNKTAVETDIAQKKNDAKNSGNQTVLDIKANYASSEPYEYAEPVYNVPKDYVFEYTDVPEGFWDAGVVERFAVFTDPDFKDIGKVSINIDDDYSDRTIKISPTLAFDLVNGESESAQDGTWGAKSKFYLVQYVSLEDGSKLDKPIVTVFTIKNEMQTSTLTQSVGTDGVYSLSWTAVDGADSYDVYYYDLGMDYARLQYTTDKTVCNYYDFQSAKDRPNSESAFDKGKLMSMNTTLMTGSGYFVVAKKADGTLSPMSNIVDIDDIANQIPVRNDFYFENNYTIHNVLDLPAYVTVEMLDGSLAEYPIDYRDKEIVFYPAGGGYIQPSIVGLNISMSSIRFDGMDENTFRAQMSELTDRQDEISGKSGVVTPTIDIPYVPNNDVDDNGTTDNGTTDNKHDKTYTEDGESETDTTEDVTEKDTEKTTEKDTEKSTEKDTKERESEKSTDEETKKDTKEDESQSSSSKDTSSTNSSIQMNHDFKITANNALSEWLAVNMLNHEEKISLSEFNEASDSDYLLDAYLEAYNQNPLIGIIDGVRLDYANNDLLISYVLDADATDKMQEDSLAKAKEISDSIIKDGMSDYEKEIAINDYLCENAAYNDKILEAISDEGTIDDNVVYEYPNSFTPYGILCENVGVCESYAEAFLLIAQECGLEAIIETGKMQNVNHEWNLVKIDGGWYMLDTTNNDSDTIKNMYVNLPDDVASLYVQKSTEAYMDNVASEYTSESMDYEYYNVNGLYSEDKAKVTDILANELTKGGDSIVVRTTSDLTQDEVNGIISDALTKAKIESCKYMYSQYIIYVNLN